MSLPLHDSSIRTANNLETGAPVSTRKHRRESSCPAISSRFERNLTTLNLPYRASIYYQAVITRNGKVNGNDSPASLREIVTKRIPGAACIEDVLAGSYLSYRSDKRKPKDDIAWPDDVESSFQRHLRRVLPMGKIKVMAWVRKDSLSAGKRTEAVLPGERCYKLSGRNELLSTLIEKDTGVVYNRKIISSHLQVLKKKLSGPLDRTHVDENCAAQDEIALQYVEWLKLGPIRWNEDEGLLELSPTCANRDGGATWRTSMLVKGTMTPNCALPFFPASGSDYRPYFVDMQFGVYLATGIGTTNHQIEHHFAYTRNSSPNGLPNDTHIPNFLRVKSLLSEPDSPPSSQEQTIVCEAKFNLSGQYANLERDLYTTMRTSVLQNNWIGWYVRSKGSLGHKELTVCENKCRVWEIGQGLAEIRIEASRSYFFQLLKECQNIEWQSSNPMTADASIFASYPLANSDSRLRDSQFHDELERRRKTKKFLDSCSFVQEIFARNPEKHMCQQRVALILWKFSEATEDSIGLINGTWSWLRTPKSLLNEPARNKTLTQFRAHAPLISVEDCTSHSPCAALAPLSRMSEPSSAQGVSILRPETSQAFKRSRAHSPYGKDLIDSLADPLDSANLQSLPRSCDSTSYTDVHFPSSGMGATTSLSSDDTRFSVFSHGQRSNSVLSSPNDEPGSAFYGKPAPRPSSVAHILGYEHDGFVRQVSPSCQSSMDSGSDLSPEGQFGPFRNASQTFGHQFLVNGASYSSLHPSLTSENHMNTTRNSNRTSLPASGVGCSPTSYGYDSSHASQYLPRETTSAFYHSMETFADMPSRVMCQMQILQQDLAGASANTGSRTMEGAYGRNTEFRVAYSASDGEIGTPNCWFNTEPRQDNLANECEAERSLSYILSTNTLDAFGPSPASRVDSTTLSNDRQIFFMPPLKDYSQQAQSQDLVHMSPQELQNLGAVPIVNSIEGTPSMSPSTADPGGVQFCAEDKPLSVSPDAGDGLPPISQTSSGTICEG